LNLLRKNERILSEPNWEKKGNHEGFFRWRGNQERLRDSLGEYWPVRGSHFFSGAFSGIGAVIGAAWYKVPPLSGVLSGVLSAIIELGLINFNLKFVDGARGEFRDLFSRIDLLLEYLGASLIYSLIRYSGPDSARSSGDNLGYPVRFLRILDCE